MLNFDIHKILDPFVVYDKTIPRKPKWKELLQCIHISFRKFVRAAVFSCVGVVPSAYTTRLSSLIIVAMQITKSNANSTSYTIRSTINSIQI